MSEKKRPSVKALREHIAQLEAQLGAQTERIDNLMLERGGLHIQVSQHQSTIRALGNQVEELRGMLDVTTRRCENAEGVVHLMLQQAEAMTLNAHAVMLANGVGTDNKTEDHLDVFMRRTRERRFTINRNAGRTSAGDNTAVNTVANEMAAAMRAKGANI